MMTFGQLIRGKRLEKGISLYELSRKSGVGYTILHKLDEGKQHDTSVYKAISICKALEIPSYVLFEINGKED